MASALKRTAHDADPHAALEPRAPALTLSPAELEALVERLCSCGTLRAEPLAPRHAATQWRSARHCARRAPDEWCRAGARASVDGNRAETKFG
jgi:hypothetical protein